MNKQASRKGKTVLVKSRRMVGEFGTEESQSIQPRGDTSNMKAHNQRTQVRRKNTNRIAISNEESSKQELINKAKEADEILCNIKDKGAIEDFYKQDFPSNSLAQKLFRTGIHPKDLTLNAMQERFRSKRIRSQFSPALIFYPTSITRMIFKLILNPSQTKFFVSSAKGIGKSFGLALLAYLLRQKTQDTRVLYIHNSAAFISNPIRYWINELRMAFPEEIEELGITEEMLQSLSNLPEDNDSYFQIKSFTTKFLTRINEKDMHLYILWDQVNSIENIENSDNPAHNLAKMLYTDLRAPSQNMNYTLALMVSATDEAAVKKVDQEFNTNLIDWQEPTEEAVKRFISDIFSLDLTKKEDRSLCKKISTFASGYFLIISEFIDFYIKGNYELEKCFEPFKNRKIVRLKMDIDKFLKADNVSVIEDEKKNLIKCRKETTARIMLSILNDTYYSGEPLPANYDGRHFIIDTSGSSNKIKPIHPLVMIAYQEALTDMELIKSMIEIFERDAPVLGFILENLVLISYPKSNVARNLPLVPLKTSQTKTFINFAQYHQSYVLDPNNFEFDKLGLYIPSIYNFALYDAFINEDQYIWGLQITKFVGKNKIQDLMSQEWKRDSKSFRYNTKNYVHEKLENLKKESRKTLKTLLISVGQDPQTDSAFDILRNSSEHSENFFYIDAKQILYDLGFEPRYVEIMQKPSLSEV